MIRGDGLTYERLLYRKYIGWTVSSLALLTLAGRWMYGVQDPGVDPPAPTMPANNSFATLQRAGTLVKADHSKIDVALSTKSEAPAVDTAELLRHHAETLRLTRAALNTGEFRLPVLRSILDQMPYLAHFRDLGRLLVLEGREYEKRGDYVRAAGSYLDVLRLAERTSHGATLIGHLTSMAVSEIGLRALWEVTPKLDADTASRAAAEVTALEAKSQPLAETLTEEKYAMQGGMLEMFRHPERLQKLDADMPGSGFSHARFLPVIYLVSPKRETYDNISNYMDALIARMQEPYPPSSAAIPEPKDILSQILLPVFVQVRHQDLRHRVNAGLVAGRLAVYGHKQLHGGFPASLGDIKMAGPFPTDPFRAYTGSIAYRRDASQPEGFVLYSVGPDAKNDGGTAIDNPESKVPQRWTAAERRRANPESKGDIVAGVNYPTPKK